MDFVDVGGGSSRGLVDTPKMLDPRLKPIFIMMGCTQLE